MGNTVWNIHLTSGNMTYKRFNIVKNILRPKARNEVNRSYNRKMR